MKKWLVFSLLAILSASWFLGVAKPLFTTSEVEAATTQDVTVTAQVGSPVPSPTPSPTATPATTPSPNPSTTPSPTATPTPSPSSTPGVSPTPFPTDTPEPSASASATPEASGTPFPSGSPSPSPTPGIFPINPITPIVEILKKVPEPLKKVSEVGSPIALLGLLPVTTAVSAAAAFGNSGFSLDILGKIFQALGLFPIGKPQGIVYDTKTKNPVAFALLTIRSLSKDPDVEPIQETVVTDTRGIYHGLKLPIGRYAIEVRHQDYLFPTKFQRPAYLTVPDFYRGEEIQVRQRNVKEFYIIPVDPLAEATEQKKNWKTQLRLAFWRVNRLLQFLVIPFFILSTAVLLISPSWWNLLIFVLYAILVTQKLIHYLNRPTLYGNVQDTSQNPLPHTIVRLLSPKTDEVIDVAMSNERGNYDLFAKKDLYKLLLTRTGYIWKEGNTPLSSTEVDTRKGSPRLTNTMEKVEQFSEDIFK